MGNNYGNYSDSALASQCMYIQLSIHELYTILQIRAYSREFGRWVAVIPMAEAVIRVKPVFCEIVFKVLMTFVFKSWMKFLYSNTNTGYSGMQDTHWLFPRSHWHSQFRLGSWVVSMECSRSVELRRLVLRMKRKISKSSLIDKAGYTPA